MTEMNSIARSAIGKHHRLIQFVPREVTKSNPNEDVTSVCHIFITIKSLKVPWCVPRIMKQESRRAYGRAVSVVVI